jgi:hypothetical protein
VAPSPRRTRCGPRTRPQPSSTSRRVAPILTGCFGPTAATRTVDLVPTVQL